MDKRGKDSIGKDYDKEKKKKVKEGDIEGKGEGISKEGETKGEGKKELQKKQNELENSEEKLKEKVNNKEGEEKSVQENGESEIKSEEKKNGDGEDTVDSTDSGKDGLKNKDIFSNMNLPSKINVTRNSSKVNAAPYLIRTGSDSVGMTSMPNMASYSSGILCIYFFIYRYGKNE